MINIDLSGKSILLTGAMGAIAEFMVRKLAEAGATLILVDIKPEDAARQTLCEWQIPESSYIYFAADITDSAALGKVVNESFRRFPQSGCESTGASSSTRQQAREILPRARMRSSTRNSQSLRPCRGPRSIFSSAVPSCMSMRFGGKPSWRRAGRTSRSTT